MTQDMTQNEDKVVWHKPTMGEIVGIFCFLMVVVGFIIAAVLMLGEA
jgi:hypothetical protein